MDNCNRSRNAGAGTDATIIGKNSTLHQDGWWEIFGLFLETANNCMWTRSCLSSTHSLLIAELKETQNLGWCFFLCFTIQANEICPVVPNTRRLSRFRSERRMGTELVCCGVTFEATIVFGEASKNALLVVLWDERLTTKLHDTIGKMRLVLVLWRHPPHHMVSILITAEVMSSSSHGFDWLDI